MVACGVQRREGVFEEREVCEREIKPYIKATFGAAIKAAALKKAGAYAKQENGKLKRIGYYPKEQILWIHGISGKYLINRQTDATYYLDAGQWRLSLSAASGG